MNMHNKSKHKNGVLSFLVILFVLYWVGLAKEGD